jgi:ABC-type Fe3+-siderophore transport system permease subunit
MIPHAMRFPILIAVSLVVFIAVLSFILRNPATRPPYYLIAVVSALVVVGGMLFCQNHSECWLALVDLLHSSGGYDASASTPGFPSVMA